MPKLKLPFICFFLIVLGSFMLMITSISISDDRTYVWTYEYKTIEKGEGEIEIYTTFSTLDIEKIKGYMSVEHQLELEVGMSERFDFSIYQIFNQDPGESLKYKGFKLRSRYKIGKKGKYFFDPLIYLEYKGIPDFSKHGIEFKIILAKDIGKLNISINPILEFEYENELEIEPGYAVGTSFEIGSLFGVGLEIKGSKKGHYMGPVISHGTENLWVALGSAIKIGKINENKPELQIRMLLGISL